MNRLYINISVFEFLFVCLSLLVLTYNVAYYEFVYLRYIFGLIAFISLGIVLSISPKYFREINRYSFYLILSTSIILIMLIRDIIINEKLSEIHPFLCVVISVFLSRFPKHFFRLIILGLLISFIIQIIEGLILKNYFFNIYNYKFEINRLQGLFSYSKETAGFCAASSIFTYLYYKAFKKNMDSIYFIILFFSLISGFLSGARIGYFFPAIIIMLSILYFNRSLLKLLTLTISLVLITYLIDFIDWKGIIGRTDQAFDLNSAGNLKRQYFWINHLKLFIDQSVLSLIFGVGVTIRDFINNGAENLFITILTQSGFLGLIIYLLLLKNVMLFGKPSFGVTITFILILVAMFFSNSFSGWADGIIVWSGFFIYKDRLKLSCKNN